MFSTFCWFQSTHPHRVRRRLLLGVVCCRSFNPRTTQGATFWVVPCIVIMLVSIHAPTQGATNLEFACTYPARRFNPRTHTGCDPITLYARLAVVKFQSTHPHGVRQRLASTTKFLLSFNPRTHTGCDIEWSSVVISVLVSIHAPTRGATATTTDTKPERKFQSTHPHGVRLIVRVIRQRNLQVSIHAPTRGATSPSWLNCLRQRFQSTHPHGVRLCQPGASQGVRLVSIHAPTRGATFVKDSGQCVVDVSIHAPTRGATQSTANDNSR